ncbi:exported hypothetical protein [Candidatus Zixiibacteriota bacterium]|nr:exported hypothetical protein [candidate division Zixibacteria bacterium]
MKRLTSLLLLLAAVLGAFAVASAEPKLTIPETVFDFGFAPQNAKISHIFWLHSTGTDSLKIIKVSPG